MHLFPKSSGAKAGPLTYILIALVVLFAAGDAFAEYKNDGRTGVYGETVSTFIHHLEKHAWIVRVLMGLVTGWLFLHLTFGVV
jgi:hypothetical protein